MVPSSKLVGSLGRAQLDNQALMPSFSHDVPSDEISVMARSVHVEGDCIASSIFNGPLVTEVSW